MFRDSKQPLLLPLSQAGPGNQYCGLKEGLILANILGLDLVPPVFIPHGTVRKTSKSYYDFAETFDFPYFLDACKRHLDVTVVPYETARETFNDPDSTVPVMIRKEGSSRSQALEYYEFYREIMNLAPQEHDFRFFPAAGQFMRTREDVFHWYETIGMGKKPSLLITGLFNSVKLGGINRSGNPQPCSKNHCLNCVPNSAFDDIYQRVNKTLQFSPLIKQLGDEYIEKNFSGREFIGFHLRICDLPRNRKFADCYSGYSEDTVWSSIAKCCENFGVRADDVFLATPPQLFTAVSDLSLFTRDRVNTYENPDVDSHLGGMIEQYICTQAKVFLRSYTNTPDEPKKAHTRSSWAELVEGMRGEDKRDSNFTIDDWINQNGSLLSA